MLFLFVGIRKIPDDYFGYYVTMSADGNRVVISAIGNGGWSGHTSRMNVSRMIHAPLPSTISMVMESAVSMDQDHIPLLELV